MTLLEQVKEDMKVFDLKGDSIGSVEAVQFGSGGATPDTKGTVDPEPPLAVAASHDTSEGSPVVLPKVNEMLHLPEPIRDRLRMHGFFKLDTSILRDDRLVIADQIEEVGENSVRLNVTRDKLIEL